jgi:DTW domain-containing protein
LNLCICASLPTLTPKTRIIILAHRVELEKSTNTGKLAARMLAGNAELIVSEAPWQPSAAYGNTAVLFPTDDAAELAHLTPAPNCLIIPDGTWAQTRRIARRHPACAQLPKVRLSTNLRSAYTLRRSYLQNGLCTLEATAAALTLLEDDPSAQSMLKAFHAWLERALLVRAGAHNIKNHRSPSQNLTD